MHKQAMLSKPVQDNSNKKMRDKYQVLERISEGNFGTVYKVKELKTGITIVTFRPHIRHEEDTGKHKEQRELP